MSVNQEGLRITSASNSNNNLWLLRTTLTQELQMPKLDRGQKTCLIWANKAMKLTFHQVFAAIVQTLKCKKITLTWLPCKTPTRLEVSTIWRGTTSPCRISRSTFLAMIEMDRTRVSTEMQSTILETFRTLVMGLIMLTWPTYKGVSLSYNNK